MSLLGRIFGSRDRRGLGRAVALFEQGEFAKALPLLREIEDDPGARQRPTLASFYLRQALLQEGRRRLEAGDLVSGATLLAEAADRWPTLPDVQFWHAYALARREMWEPALAAVQQALRYNPEYVLARLLEAACLHALDQRAAAASSLDALVTSGARTEHPVARFYQDGVPHDPDRLPDDMLQRLDEALHTHSRQDALEAAVACCRRGDWEEGQRRLAQLCAEHPTYPDYQVKLAAALFQLRRNREALAAVNRALRLQPRYRTAAHLKALILADQRRFREAAAVVAAHPHLTDPVPGHPGEELFCAYLVAVLAILTGREAEAEAALAGWGALSSSFPRAEVARAAADGLAGRLGDAGDRLLELAAQWREEPEYLEQACGCLLLQGRHAQVESLLLQWPLDESGGPRRPDRHWLVTAELTVARGEPVPDAPPPTAVPPAAAVRYLEARSAMPGEPVRALGVLRDLEPEALTAPAARLLAEAALAAGAVETAVPPPAAADLQLRRVQLLHAGQRPVAAAAIVRRHQELHPLDPRWTWLDPRFWLDPVRGWIG